MLILKYNSKWINNFELIQKTLLCNLTSCNVSIEHVGSTSIPQLGSKPIIDIDLVYFNLSDFAKIKDHLEKLGYYHNGNQGIVGREVFKRNNADHPILDTISHHLYVCHTNSQELQRHLLFRDYLRINEDARITYENLKLSIALQANQDKKKYARLKENQAKHFINGIIEKAEKQLNL